MGGTVVLDGQEFFTRNGGPQFSFTPAISLFASCRAEAEVDELCLSQAGKKAAAAG